MNSCNEFMQDLPAHGGEQSHFHQHTILEFRYVVNSVVRISDGRKTMNQLKLKVVWTLIFSWFIMKSAEIHLNEFDVSETSEAFDTKASFDGL